MSKLTLVIAAAIYTDGIIEFNRGNLWVISDWEWIKIYPNSRTQEVYGYTTPPYVMSSPPTTPIGLYYRVDTSEGRKGYFNFDEIPGEPLGAPKLPGVIDSIIYPRIQLYISRSGGRVIFEHGHGGKFQPSPSPDDPRIQYRVGYDIPLHEYLIVRRSEVYPNGT